MRNYLAYITYYLYAVKLEKLAIFLINKRKIKKNTFDYNVPTYIITSHNHDNIIKKVQEYFLELKIIEVIILEHFDLRKDLKRLLHNRISSTTIKNSNFIVIDDSKQNQTLLLRYLFSKSRGKIILFTTLETYLTCKLIPWLRNEIYYHYPDYIFTAENFLKKILDNNNFSTLQNPFQTEVNEVNNEYENFISTLNKSISFVENHREKYLGKLTFFQLVRLYFYKKFYNIKKQY